MEQICYYYTGLLQVCIGTGNECLFMLSFFKKRNASVCHVTAGNIVHLSNWQYNEFL